MELKGKTAIITGSTGQLGRDLTLALARVGCHCICHYYKNKSGAERLVETIRQEYSVNATSIGADLTDINQIENLFNQAEPFGKAQILVNCAAIFERTPLEQINPQQARQLFELNTTAAIMTSKIFAAALKNKQTGNSEQVIGKIINIADVAAIRPWAEYSLYSASKAALLAVTKSLAKELAPGILVNAIAPGIATWPDNQSEQEKNKQLHLIPLGRFAETKEIAAAMIFLLENDYITGQTLIVAGGRCI